MYRKTIINSLREAVIVLGKLKHVQQVMKVLAF